MKIFLHTLGCKLNYFETEAMAENLRQNGYKVVQNFSEADTVVINTCTVTAKADSKSRQEMKKAKRLGKKVIATGCYATTDASTLETYDYIDQIITNEHKMQIASYLNEIPKNLPSKQNFPVVSRFERTRAFIKIQDGCNKFCTYCKIPYARGRSTSYSISDIRESLQNLVREGYKEIVLTGVNISDYHFEDQNLTALIATLLETPGDYRLRLSSLQPDEFDPKLIHFTSHPRFTRHFHLSLQSGSNSVLKRMNRHYTGEEFLSLVKQIRDICPDCGITTDIIVGFPGETEKEFLETLDLVKKAIFTRLHLFPYSPRQGTPAARLKDMPLKIKKEREEILRQSAREVLIPFVKKHFLNKPQKILIETSKNGICQGYNSQYFKCLFHSDQTPNHFITQNMSSYLPTLEGLDLHN